MACRPKDDHKNKLHPQEASGEHVVIRRVIRRVIYRVLHNGRIKERNKRSPALLLEKSNGKPIIGRTMTGS